MARSGKAIGDFVRCQRGATALVVGTALPAVLLALSLAVEMAGIVDYRQKLLAAAELTCRQATLYLADQQSKRDRISAAELENVRIMASANLSMLGLPNEPWPSGIYFADDVPVIDLQGRHKTLMFDVAMLEDFAPRVVLSCDQVATSDVVSSGAANQVITSISAETGHSLKTSQRQVVTKLNEWTSSVGFQIVGNDASPIVTSNGNFFLRMDFGTNGLLQQSIDLPAGDYELAYFYRSEGTIPAYSGQSICGRGADVDWATAVGQTYRVDVWIGRTGRDPIALDTCVYSEQWVERRIPFRAYGGSYDLSIKAAGIADNKSGLIDELRICRSSCP